MSAKFVPLSKRVTTSFADSLRKALLAGPADIKSLARQLGVDARDVDKALCDLKSRQHVARVGSRFRLTPRGRLIATGEGDGSRELPDGVAPNVVTHPSDELARVTEQVLLTLTEDGAADVDELATRLCEERRVVVLALSRLMRDQRVSPSTHHDGRTVYAAGQPKEPHAANARAKGRAEQAYRNWEREFSASAPQSQPAPPAPSKEEPITFGDFSREIVALLQRLGISEKASQVFGLELAEAFFCMNRGCLLLFDGGLKVVGQPSPMHAALGRLTRIPPERIPDVLDVALLAYRDVVTEQAAAAAAKH